MKDRELTRREQRIFGKAMAAWAAMTEKQRRLALRAIGIPEKYIGEIVRREKKGRGE